jgi:hypothetical protein
MKRKVLHLNFLHGKFFTLQDPFAAEPINTMMNMLYTVFSLAPAPLFFLGFLWSLYNPPAVCTSFPLEMTLMWFVMFLAHLTPWFMFYQRYLARR